MTAYLSDITDFIEMHPHYAAWAVFGLAFSEAIPIIGTVVPGSTLIVATSALAIGADISPWLLLAAATLGAILGDGASFWLGQRCHRQILQRWPLNQFPQLIARSEAFFNRYGAASVFLARFTAVVRAFVPLIAGIVQMPARQFYLANILSAIVWAPAHVFPGVVFGLLVSLAGARPEQIFILAVAAMLLGVAVVRAVRYLLKRGAASSE
ncbi:MAG TPA: DedA family protein [Xanthobacteraceae bacterium]|nr:DedA family protein [Xanthobacteraceae bacterium]